MIATEVGVTAEHVDDATLGKDTIVFLGSGNYAGKPAKKILKFIEDNTFKSRTVCLFGTSGAGEGKEVGAMEKLLQSKGSTIKGTFYCKGKFLFANRRRPNDDDLKKARFFAKKMMK